MAISCCSDLMDDCAFTSGTSGAVVSSVTGAKSFTRSYGTFGISVMLAACAGSIITIV